jgi:hypothetical protein
MSLIDELKTARIVGSTRLIRRCIALCELLERRMPNSVPHRIIENILREDLRPFVDMNSLDSFDAEDFAVHELLVETGYLTGDSPDAADCGCKHWPKPEGLDNPEGSHHPDCPNAVMVLETHPVDERT